MVAIDPTRLLINKNPSLAKQWHPAKNDDLLLETVYAGSSKKVWWQCDICKYEWAANISSRNRGRGCPNCAGKVINETNSLLSLYPHIAAQYSKKNAVPVEAIASISHKKVWWDCSDNPDHEWEAIVGNRVRQGDGCPYCSGRYATKENNLAIQNPKLAAEFNLERNFPLTPYDVTPTTHTKIWWKCNKNHEWRVAVTSRNRLNKMSYCPYCTGTKATHDNNLVVTHPDVAKQYHPTKNKLPVEKIRYGSSTKRWWICEKNHAWEATVSSRTHGKKATGCPECSPTPRTSSIEIEIRLALEAAAVLSDIQTTYNAFITTDCNKKVAVDVLGKVNGKRVVVEFDSWWWHSGKGRTSRGNETTYAIHEARDVRKTQVLLESGYIVFRIREKTAKESLPTLPILHKNLIQIQWNQADGIPMLVEVIREHLK